MPVGAMPTAAKVARPRSRAIIAYGVPTWQEGQPANYSAQTFETYVVEGYQKNELIYSCLTANADSAASVSLKVYDKKNHEEIEDHPLRRLLGRPSPFLSEFDFWALTSIYEDLAGVAYFEKVRNGAGEVIELFPLRPDYVKYVPSSSEFISEYLYCIPGMPEKRLKTQDVLVFKRFDPRDLRNAINPTRVAARVGDVDNNLTDYIKVLEEKGFQPPGVLKSKLELTDADVDSILQRLQARYAGVENWNKPLVLDRDAEYQRTGFTMQEMDFTAQDERNEARICSIYQIPPIIVGARIGLRYGTYANYQEARLSWWEDKLTPRYKHRSDVIDAQLAPDFGEDIDTEFDMSKVPALQAKKQAERMQYSSEFTAGLITRNMFYKVIGEKPLPPETGDVFVQSIAVQSIPLNGPPEPPPAPEAPPPAEKPTEEPSSGPEMTTAAEQQDKETVPASAKGSTVITPVGVAAYEAKIADLQTQLKVLADERDRLRAMVSATPPPVDAAVISERAEPFTPAGQLKAAAETLDKRTAELTEPAAPEPPPPVAPEPEPATDAPPPEPVEQPENQPAESETKIEDTTEAETKAAPPFADLLKVTPENVARWEAEYQKLKKKAKGGKGHA